MIAYVKLSCWYQSSISHSNLVDYKNVWWLEFLVKKNLKGEKLEPISFEPFQSLRERNALSELIWICSAAGLKTIVLIRKVL